VETTKATPATTTGPKSSDKTSKNALATTGVVDPKTGQSPSNPATITGQKTASTTEQNSAALNGKVVTPTEQITETNKDNPATTVEPTSTPATETEPQKPLSAEEVIGKDLFFKLFRASNKAVVEGDVDAIDTEKSRRMATYKGNSPVKVIMPAGKSKQISFVCEVFGYRKLQKEFDPNNPSEELSLDANGNLVMPFELIRLQKGDIAIMYNVFFFKDAAVMRPESRYEVNNLLELLNENPSYKIKIHGHTNGNSNGKILSMDKSGNFFSLTNTRTGFGSAKKLSEERALLMREYLISNNIEPDRMQIKAWGGNRPIHDKNAVRAQENVRVEIEILSE
jgi:outer membrane protein OmpA-like peptidoglycan-associated protein